MLLLFGEFNFWATPFAPPGTRIGVHINPQLKTAWCFEGQKGWHMGPEMYHYRCITGYFQSTRATRIYDTVDSPPSAVIPFLAVTATNFLKQVALDITNMLTSPPSTIVPTLSSGDPIRNTLLDISNSLQHIEYLPNNNPPSTHPIQVPRVIQQQYNKDNSTPPHVQPSSVQESTQRNREIIMFPPNL